MTREQLDRLAREWRLRLATRDVLIVGASVCVLASLGALWLRPALLAIVAVAAFAVVLGVRLALSRPWNLDAVQVARHLDRAFPQFEESSTLWLRPKESLTLVERLQRARTDEAARALSSASTPSFAAPPRSVLRKPALYFGGALALLVAVVTWRFVASSSETRIAGEAATARATPKPEAAVQLTQQWPRVLEAELLIAPPAYTGRVARRVDGLNAEVEEGSVVTWAVALEHAAGDIGLRFGSSDAAVVPLRASEDGKFRATRSVAESELYGFIATMPDGAMWRPHELHSLKVIKDRAPAVKILQPAIARTEIAPAASAQATVEVIVSDDYAVADAHLIATVAKGTGEAVKFREEKITFDRNDAVDEPTNGRRLIKTFDLRALGLEPGDELYFFVEATDNREPSPNRARSETRFIILKGPEQTVSTPGTGVAGLNLIPQYFRSQRQIIIDTEKLIADQATLPESEFRNRANNLAIDQQLLRQRYGEFLGEEADHGAPASPVAAEDEHEAHSPDDGHDHGPSPAREGAPTQQDIVAEYGHQHDSQDEATLFDRETKGTMRQALAAMWEAERFLRVGQPREALAPENRALEIIKALQQADRSYVQRVGFEAAPINFAARRLRGEVEDVPERTVAPAAKTDDGGAESTIRDVLRIAPWSQVGRPLAASELEALRRVEPALTVAANQDPDVSLAALEELRRLINVGSVRGDGQSKLEAALLRLLPPAEAQPQRSLEVSPKLADPYFRNLELER